MRILDTAMRTLRKLFKPLLALLLSASAVPSWACVRACDGRTSSLSCVKLCARSGALLSESGRLPLLGAMACSVAGVDAAPALSAQAFALSAPGFAATMVDAVCGAPVAQAPGAAAATRGPPPPHSYLSSQHPFANGPPTLL